MKYLLKHKLTHQTTHDMTNPYLKYTLTHRKLLRTWLDQASTEQAPPTVADIISLTFHLTYRWKMTLAFLTFHPPSSAGTYQINKKAFLLTKIFWFGGCSLIVDWRNLATQNTQKVITNPYNSVCLTHRGWIECIFTSHLTFKLLVYLGGDLDHYRSIATQCNPLHH